MDVNIQLRFLGKNPRNSKILVHVYVNVKRLYTILSFLSCSPFRYVTECASGVLSADDQGCSFDHVKSEKINLAFKKASLWLYKATSGLHPY